MKYQPISVREWISIQDARADSDEVNDIDSRRRHYRLKYIELVRQHHYPHLYVGKDGPESSMTANGHSTVEIAKEYKRLMVEESKSDKEAVWALTGRYRLAESWADQALMWEGIESEYLRNGRPRDQGCFVHVPEEQE